MPLLDHARRIVLAMANSPIHLKGRLWHEHCKTRRAQGPSARNVVMGTLLLVIGILLLSAIFRLGRKALAGQVPWGWHY
jgi:hypothetical protein